VPDIAEYVLKPWSLSGSAPYDPTEVDCETCGGSYDHVAVDVSVDLMCADARIGLGCTGGGNIQDAPLPVVVTWLREWGLPWVTDVADQLAVLADAMALAAVKRP
jgi:hypothetical protein